MSDQDPTASNDQEATHEDHPLDEPADMDDEDDGDVDDVDARGLDDDSGFGPDSYFAHAMNKDD